MAVIFDFLFLSLHHHHIILLILSATFTITITFVLFIQFLLAGYWLLACYPDSFVLINIRFEDIDIFYHSLHCCFILEVETLSLADYLYLQCFPLHLELATSSFKSVVGLKDNFLSIPCLLIIHAQFLGLLSPVYQLNTVLFTGQQHTHLEKICHW